MEDRTEKKGGLKERAFQKHLRNATREIYAAMEIMTQGQRLSKKDTLYVNVKQAVDFIASVRPERRQGDVEEDARALVAWVERRGRQKPVRSKGAEYRRRLSAAIDLLSNRDTRKPQERYKPKEERSRKFRQVEDPQWNFAKQLAEQQGQGDSLAYIQAIYETITGRRTDDE